MAAIDGNHSPEKQFFDSPERELFDSPEKEFLDSLEKDFLNEPSTSQLDSQSIVFDPWKGSLKISDFSLFYSHARSVRYWLRWRMVSVKTFSKFFLVLNRI